MRTALLILVLTSIAGIAAAAENAAKPNIVFILADDLGYGDLGSYGQKRIATPELDRMAAEGRRFVQHYAGSTVCAPSRCSLMTGLHTGHAFIRGNGRENLRRQDLTVAEVLRKAGYATAHFGKWGIGHEGSDGLPTRKGFDEFYGYLDHTHAHNYYPSHLYRGEERVPLLNVVPDEGQRGQGVASVRREYSHDLVMEETLAYIDRKKDVPFFIYLGLTIPHANNEAKQAGMEVPDQEPYRRRDWPEAEKNFAAMVTRMDQDVGRILERLRRHGIDERTVVLFTSDNGPHKEGGHDPDFFDSNGPLRGLKRDVYEGGIRVPMIVRWPGKIAAGSVSRHVSAHWDVLPTLAELAGALESVPPGLDGISFVPEILGNEGAQRRHDRLYWVFFERGGARAVRFGSWKAVIEPEGAPLELYDLDADLGELRNLAAQHPELVARARKLLDEAYAPSEVWKYPPAKPKRVKRY